jgi:CBS domain-containing protein
MLKAKDIMSKRVVTVSPETKIDQAGQLLLENHFNGLPVVDPEGRLRGIIPSPRFSPSWTGSSP